MPSPIDCAALRRTVKKCRSDVRNDERRIRAIEHQLGSVKDQHEIAKLKKERETLETDITQASAIEEEALIEINQHCGGS
ncbi:hypothetical protein [Streptomyces sp. NPDC051132]|uniref:hypothetical protein n=1 Tax=unclassified Streptomyces TaxID=2593676 RepID=UPI003437C781